MSPARLAARHASQRRLPPSLLSTTCSQPALRFLVKVIITGLLVCRMATATVTATDLRAELKEWERAFAAANGGKKAGRQDIKGDPDIGNGF